MLLLRGMSNKNIGTRVPTPYLNMSPQRNSKSLYDCKTHCKSFCRKPSEEEKWNVPDRQTGLLALQELNPERKWNFVMVNKKFFLHIPRIVQKCYTILLIIKLYL